jgi:pseudouridine synthase
MSTTIRLNKLLSAFGVASRRSADELMTQGRVELNGRVVTELGTKADPDRDEIKVDGRRLKSAPVKRYLLMNKPVGVMSTRSDPQRRTTVVDLVSQAGLSGYFYPVGRLDYDSEGLIILTNDGAFAQRVSHPSYELERTYEALVEGVPDERDLERLRKGVPVEGQRTQPARVQLKRIMPGKRGEQSMLEIVIHEGRNRQIRRMADAIAHPVARLKRVRIGNVTDSSLKPGHFRDLNPGEIRDLLKAKPGEFGVSDGVGKPRERRPAREGARRPVASDERRPAPSGARKPPTTPPAGTTPRSNWRRGPGRRPSARPRGKD